MMTAITRPFPLVLCMLPAALLMAAEPEWPQWRGPAGQGHAPAAHDLPVTWSETENITWKTPLPGRGWSSPVIGDGRIWMTTATQEEATPAERARRLEGNRMAGQLEVSGAVTIRVLCVEQATGTLLHDLELFTIADPQPIHKLNSYASPSPVLAGDRLYCHCGDFGVACIDATTGRVLWKNHELRLNHENGPGSTPVLWRDKLIVHLDGSDVQSIAAYDTATGMIAWQTARSGAVRDDPQLKKAYGTPLLIELAGREVLVSPAADWLYAYDPATGKELWKMSYGVLGFSVVPRPVVAGDLLFMSTSFLQPELLAVRLAGPETPPEIVWREKKGAPTMSSPLVVDDLLIMVSDKGVGTCLDARTGERLWAERLGGNFSSSPFMADGRIYVGNRDGDTFVIRPGRAYELLATNHLEGGIFATPAAVGRAIYLRTELALYRIEKPAAAATARASAAAPPPKPASDTTTTVVGTATAAVTTTAGVAAADPASTTASPPAGETFTFAFEQSRVYPGTTREVTVYVPRQYDGQTPACVHVHQDGVQANAPRVFDRLIHQQQMPVTIGVFVKPGVVPAAREGALPRFNRSYEYDSLGGDYAKFLLDELLPAVETHRAADGRAILLSKRATDRSIGGNSSGAICGFTAAWERPDGFSRVFSGIGTYVGLRGGNIYSTLIRKVEPKPIRVFLEDGSGDLNIYGGDWWMANQALERSLTFAGYEVRHAWGEGGHNGTHAAEVFPEAIKWLWAGWPEPPARGRGSPQLQEILVEGEDWQLVGEGYQVTEGPAANAKGELFFNDVGNSKTYRVTSDWTAEIWLEDSRKGDGQNFTPDGRLVAASAADTAILAWSTEKKPTMIAQGFRGNDLVVNAAGEIYVTEPGWDGKGQSKIHHIAPDGTDRVVDKGLQFSNGLCLSPDQTLLYVADSRSHWVWSWQVQPDGSLSKKQRFFHVHVPDTAEDSGADGMRVDRDGRLWVATRMGIQVCDQAGRVNCIIPTPNGRVSNLSFGGPDFDMLLATCGDKVYVRKVKVRGAPNFLPPQTPATPRL